MSFTSSARINYFPESFKKKIFKDKANMDTLEEQTDPGLAVDSLYFFVVTVRKCCVMIWTINVPPPKKNFILKACSLDFDALWR